MNEYCVTYRNGEIEVIKAAHFSLSGPAVCFEDEDGKVIAMVNLESVRSAVKQD